MKNKETTSNTEVEVIPTAENQNGIDSDKKVAAHFEIPAKNQFSAVKHLQTGNYKKATKSISTNTLVLPDRLRTKVTNTMTSNTNLTTNYLKAHIKTMSVSLFFLIITTPLMSQPLQTVPYVDLKKYAGKWYEIASFPQRFQKGCNCTTAEYTLTDKGYVIVENRCNKDSINGKQSHIKGKAFVVENSGNAKLNIQFFWPFKGKYWIIDLDDDYRYAVVGHPNRKYLWILSRTATINDTIYQQIISRIKANGFDISKIKRTNQK